MQAGAWFNLKQGVAGSGCGLLTDMWLPIAKHGNIVITMLYISLEWETKHFFTAFFGAMYPYSMISFSANLIDAVKGMDPSLLASMWTVTMNIALNNETMITSMNENIHSERSREFYWKRTIGWRPYR